MSRKMMRMKEGSLECSRIEMLWLKVFLRQLHHTSCIPALLRPHDPLLTRISVTRVSQEMFPAILFLACFFSTQLNGCIHWLGVGIVVKNNRWWCADVAVWPVCQDARTGRVGGRVTCDVASCGNSTRRREFHSTFFSMKYEEMTWRKQQIPAGRKDGQIIILPFLPCLAKALRCACTYASS